MKLNKLLILFAGVALMFTACKKDVEREPSPAFPEEVAALYFPSADERGAEIDPSEGIYKSTVTIARRDSVGELTVALKVVRNDSNIFKVPESVTFADQVKSVDFEISFEGAEDGKTYNLLIEADASQVNPYMEGAAAYLYSVTPIKWIQAEKPAIFDGNIFGAAFGIPLAYWYVPYEYAELGGGALRFRFTNAYASMATEVDEWGIYNGCAFNDPGDWHEEQDWITIINVSKDGVADMPSHDIGVEWSYGMFATGLACNLTGKYDTYPFGEYENGVITFPAGSVFLTLPTNGSYLTSEDHHIWINPDVLIEAIKEANSAVRLSDFEDGFNDAGIEWDTVPCVLKTFMSQIQDDSWDQLLLKAVDPNSVDSVNPESDFHNLFYLPSLYAEGLGLAFYFDEEKGTIKLPREAQETGLDAFGQSISVAPVEDQECFVEEVTVKGTAVKVFHFPLEVQTSGGASLGVYEELFYVGDNNIVWEESDFLGNFIFGGQSAFGDPDAAMPVQIQKDGDKLFLLGVDYAAAIECEYDAETGLLSIYPQALDSLVLSSGTFDMALYTLTAAGSVSTSDPIQMTFGLDGVMKVAAESPAVGYLLRSEAAGGWVDGYQNLTMTPATEPAAASAKKSVKAHNSFVRVEKKHEWKVVGRVQRHRLSSDRIAL